MTDRPLDDPTAQAGRLYDSHGPSLYRYALMLLASPAAAEDAVQQVFAALLRGDVASIQNDAHYLRRAIRNECYSVLRRRTAHHLVPLEDDDGGGVVLVAVSAGTTPEERLGLERALRALGPEQREVVHLHVYEGLTFQEIATAAGESINTVASRYRYALAKMRELLT